MSYGIPVLTTRRGALPEAAGDAALYIENPYDIHEIAAGLIKITNDTAFRAGLVDRGKHKYQDFTFNKFKHRVAQALHGLDRK